MYNNSNYVLNENERAFLQSLENKFCEVFPNSILYIFEQKKEIYFQLGKRAQSIGFIKFRNKTKLRYEYEKLNKNGMKIIAEIREKTGRVSGKDFAEIYLNGTVILEEVSLEKALSLLPHIVQGAYNKYLNSIFASKSLNLKKFSNPLTDKVEDIPNKFV